MSELAIRSAIFPLVRGLWRTRIVRGAEHLSAGPCFLYGNHSNNFDPFLVNWPLPLGQCSSGVLTAEYMQGGPITAAFRGIGLLSTRKRVPEPHLVPQIVRLLRAGRNVLIYPEGGRRWDGRPGRWIESTAKLFARLGYPVHPVITHGSYVAWPRWADWPRPARIEVEVLPAVPLERTSPVEEAVSRLAEPIALDENLPPESTRPNRAFRPADGIQRLLYRDPVTGQSGGLYSADGIRIGNPDLSLDWEMMPDSRIFDRQSGRLLLTGDLYQAIRSMPLPRLPGGAILSDRVDARSGANLQSLSPAAPARATLRADHIVLESGRATEIIDMEDVLYEGIERNYKLQLTLRTGIVELSFTAGGSALQWEDSLARLRSGT